MKKGLILTLIIALLSLALTACTVKQPQTNNDTPSSSLPAQNGTSSLQTDAIVTPQSSLPAQSQKITVDRAKEIALQHAGVSSADAKFLRAEYEYDDGVASYEIEFNVGVSEYEYDIKAADGTILKAEKDDKNILKTNTATLKTKDEAKSIALQHAGVSEKDARFLKAEYDADDGIAHYDVEFKSGGYEYDYEINAESGAIIKSEKDFDD